MASLRPRSTSKGTPSVNSSDGGIATGNGPARRAEKLNAGFRPCHTNAAPTAATRRMPALRFILGQQALPAVPPCLAAQSVQSGGLAHHFRPVTLLVFRLHNFQLRGSHIVRMMLCHGCDCAHPLSLDRRLAPVFMHAYAVYLQRNGAPHHWHCQCRGAHGCGIHA